MRKTFVHFQSGLPSWAARFYTSLHTKEPDAIHWAKIMDPGEAQPLLECPWVHWVIRKYDTEDVAKAEVLGGAQGAWNQYLRLKLWFQARPWLASPRYWFEHHNEPTNYGALSTPQNQELTAQYGAAFTRIIWEKLGIRSVAGCLGVGHPEPQDAVRVMALPMVELLLAEGMYSLHEYGWPVMDSGGGGWTLRYRTTIQALRNAGATRLPPIVITESGIDKLLVNEVGGWQTVNNDPRWYAGQLAWYDSELCKDNYVWGHFVFTGTANHPWETYEVTEQVADEIDKRWVKDDPPLPPGGDVKYCNKYGEEIGEAAFRAIFGDVTIESATGSRYKVVEMWDSGLNVGMDCQVYVRNGYGNGARLVIYNGGINYGSVKAPDMQEFNVWACYAPPDVGAYSIAIQDASRQSDIVRGLGWLCATSHRHVQRIVFEKVDDGANQPPKASFTWNAEGLKVEFDASDSYDPDGEIVDYAWSFGDGNVGGGILTYHVYAEGGDYPVTLTVIDNQGAEGKIGQIVTVNEEPTPPNIEEAIRLIREAQVLLDEALELLT